MSKLLEKVFAGGLLLVLAGALAVGAVRIWQNTRLTPHAEHIIEQRSTPQEPKDGQAHSESIPTPETHESGSDQGQRELSADRYSQVQAWSTIEGTAVALDDLVLQTADGKKVQVGLGLNSYRESQGFVVHVGDTLRVKGYHEEGEFKAGQVENLTSGEQIVLREETGRPMWSGQGRRKNARDG